MINVLVLFCCDRFLKLLFLFLGSAFQLASDGDPLLGVPVTTAIVFTGIPGGFFLLYAAILKGIAETEEDDKAFLSGK